MPDRIKKQIMDRVASNLAPLKPAAFRDITHEHDSTKDSKALPALMIFDGPETTVAKTTTQWTCRFPVYFKIVFSSPRNAQVTKDALVAEVQRKSKPTSRSTPSAASSTPATKNPPQTPTQSQFTALRSSIRWSINAKSPTPPSFHDEASLFRPP
jgi:hypothetical protein